jgi:hypothetical protein
VDIPKGANLMTWRPEPELLEAIVAAVPDMLSDQKENGQFGTEPWTCGDQNRIFSLAAAWSLEDSSYHHDKQVLAAIIRGGDALIDAQDKEGKWTFLKKDYSTWGQILMPWTYSRWIRAYQLVKEAMPNDAIERWDCGLTLGFEGISATCLGGVHNIPAHHAMALFCAGTVFGRDEWRDQARSFMARVAEEQSPNGWWAELKGPVVSYNFVYSDSLGTYYGMSGDGDVLKALERAASYHASFTYPDGSSVETIDGRNPYHAGVHLGNPGFSHTAAGRGFLAQQHRLHLESGGKFEADYAASMLLYGGEGEIAETPSGKDRNVFKMGDEAATLRIRPWYICVSSFVTELPDNRWGQDRQNFLSVYHDKTGLILGGGNTKLQPLWSTFTVGDTSLLSHTPGEEEPDFSAREGLIHVPDRAAYTVDEGGAALELGYGSETCSVELLPDGETAMLLRYSSTAHSVAAVEAHVTLIPNLNKSLQLSTNEEVSLGYEGFLRTGIGWIQQAGWRLEIPPDSTVIWPALPHNPYRKAGDAKTEEGLLVVTLPLSSDSGTAELKLEIL